MNKIYLDCQGWLKVRGLLFDSNGKYVPEVSRINVIDYLLTEVYSDSIDFLNTLVELANND